MTDSEKVHKYEKKRKAFLTLIRLGVGTSRDVKISNDVEWDAVMEQALEQGLCGVCLDGLTELRNRGITDGMPNQMTLLQWIGQAEAQRMQYEQAWTVARRLDSLWHTEGIHATILKGRSIAKYYPMPHHRYSCDLDVFVCWTQWERACELLEGQGIALDREVYKEVEFTVDDVYVECHRYITPVRGNKHLKEFELYLRSILSSEPIEYFEGTTLVCPPLMFTLMLYVEHALGDLLHGHLSLKEIVDWVVLRRQGFDKDAFAAKCREFKFDRFMALIDALAAVVEGRMVYEELPSDYKEVFDGLFEVQEAKEHKSWFRKRVDLFFDIVRNGDTFHRYGYMSMPSFLWNSVWAHFFDKEVKI